LLNRIPDRRQFHITDPFFLINFWFINPWPPTTKGAAPRPPIAYVFPLERRLIQSAYPSSSVVAVGNVTDLLTAICSGQIPTGLVADSVATVSMFHKPPD